MNSAPQKAEAEVSDHRVRCQGQWVRKCENGGRNRNRNGDRVRNRDGIRDGVRDRVACLCWGCLRLGGGGGGVGNC